MPAELCYGEIAEALFVATQFLSGWHDHELLLFAGPGNDTPAAYCSLLSC